MRQHSIWVRVEIRPRLSVDLPGCESLAALVHARDGYPPRYADDLGVLFTRPILDVATQFAPAIRRYESLEWVRLGTVTATFSDSAPLDEYVYLGPDI